MNSYVDLLNSECTKPISPSILQHNNTTSPAEDPTAKKMKIQSSGELATSNNLKNIISKIDLKQGLERIANGGIDEELVD